MIVNSSMSVSGSRQVHPDRAALLLLLKSVLDRRCRFRLGHFWPSAYVTLKSTLAGKESAGGVPRRNPRLSRDKSLFLISLSCCRDCRVSPNR